jgi:DNA polymerase
VDLDELGDLRQLREEAVNCTHCPLYGPATQTVFGEGPEDAWLVLIGEQPGDSEDRAGHPFVGPAGRMLDRALLQAGITRADAYVTNAVKHFKFEQRGKRRIHQRPNAAEIRACRPWLDAELRLVKPSVVVTLGATAGRALLGVSFRISQRRGTVVDWGDGLRLVPTVHPSALLRIPDADDQREAFEAMVADLELVRELEPAGESA